MSPRSCSPVGATQSPNLPLPFWHPHWMRHERDALHDGHEKKRMAAGPSSCGIAALQPILKLVYIN